MIIKEFDLALLKYNHMKLTLKKRIPRDLQAEQLFGCKKTSYLFLNLNVQPF